MHAGCNLGVHDMNNTILMVCSGGLGCAGLCCAGSSAASLRGMCLCLAPAMLRATDTGSAFPGRLNKPRSGTGSSCRCFSADLCRSNTNTCFWNHPRLVCKIRLPPNINRNIPRQPRKVIFNPGWVYSRPETLDSSNTTLNHINMRPFFTQL